MSSSSYTLAVVSAMITPALLILACASLVGATAQRMARLVDRVRELREEFSRLSVDQTSSLTEEDLEDYFRHVRRNAWRSKHLQWALILLYCALSFLVATSVALGLATVRHSGDSWLPVAFGLVAVLFLLAAGLVLIAESWVGLASVTSEMRSALRVAERARQKH